MLHSERDVLDVISDDALMDAVQRAVWTLRIRHHVRAEGEWIYDEWELEAAWRVQDAEAETGERPDVYDVAWRIMWELHREGRLEVTA